MRKTVHWTEESAKDFLFAIALDFVDQLEAKMEAMGWDRAKLAQKAKVSKGYVSQVLNNPGNLSLDTIVKFARALKLKVSVVAYDDGDESNERGPINAEIFRLCWERANKPADMWSFRESLQVRVKPVDCHYYIPKGHHGWKQSDTGSIHSLKSDHAPHDGSTSYKPASVRRTALLSRMNRPCNQTKECLLELLAA